MKLFVGRDSRIVGSVWTYKLLCYSHFMVGFQLHKQSICLLNPYLFNEIIEIDCTPKFVIPESYRILTCPTRGQF